MSDARDRLEQLLSPSLVDALAQLVDELVDERLDAIERRDGRDWYTLEEAAERLGCTYDAVWMRAKRGRLVSRRHGRRVYVSARSVDELTGDAMRGHLR